MNNELKDVLFEGENVLWQGAPHKFCFMWRAAGKLLPIAILWLLFDGTFISIMVATGLGKDMWLFLVIFFALHLMPVWSFLGKFIKSKLEHKNVIYAVTDRRVVVRTGVIGLDFENINYTDISNIRTDVSILERLCNVGSVYITTSSGASTCLMAVKDPYAVSKMINKIFLDVKADIHYPNALRPEENPGYNTKYAPK